MRSLHSRNSTRYDVPSVALAVLSSPCFALLLERIGVDALHQLLAHTRLFWPLQNDCLLQLTGLGPAGSLRSSHRPYLERRCPGRPAHGRRAAAARWACRRRRRRCSPQRPTKAAVEQLAAPPRKTAGSGRRRGRGLSRACGGRGGACSTKAAGSLAGGGCARTSPSMHAQGAAFTVDLAVDLCGNWRGASATAAANPARGDRCSRWLPGRPVEPGAAGASAAAAGGVDAAARTAAPRPTEAYASRAAAAASAVRRQRRFSSHVLLRYPAVLPDALPPPPPPPPPPLQPPPPPPLHPPVSVSRPGRRLDDWGAQAQFRALLQCAVPHARVASWLRTVCRAVLPRPLIGARRNWRTLSRSIGSLVVSPPVGGVDTEPLAALATTDAPWIRPAGDGRPPLSRLMAGRRLLEKLHRWARIQLLLPLARRAFHVGELQGGSGVLQYWARCVWARARRLVLRRLKRSILRVLPPPEAATVLASGRAGAVRPFGSYRRRAARTDACS